MLGWQTFLLNNASEHGEVSMSIITQNAPRTPIPNIYDFIHGKKNAFILRQIFLLCDHANLYFSRSCKISHFLCMTE